ncbi:MAG: hypothetical protein PHU95_02135 [Candidatus Thermoplasmatota archaeon]|nr:hypothetical protein [Candidatus Thermoplasmatota archaeon]
MEDHLDRLGVPPSDRRKLESMGITRLEQLAILTPEKLGLGRGKGSTLIRRARNILAHENIRDLEVMPDLIRVQVREVSRPVVSSVLSVIGVYDAPPGAASLEEQGSVLEIRRRNRAFDRIVEAARIEQEILNGRAEEESRHRPMTEEETREFARNRAFDGFWRTVFEGITGNQVMKQALAVSLFSTFEEPVHTLVIGEPGSSKTLAKEIVERTFGNLTTVGANTTRAGLVINMATGEMGALAYSDRRVVLVDEMDKIPEGDIEHCYELLSNGRCSVHSAKIHEEIESRFIMMAFANPASQVFREAPLLDIPLPPLLMSRFALIVKTETIDKQRRLALFRQKFYGGGELEDRPSFYDQWVEMARAHQPPLTASSEAVDAYLGEVNELVEEHYHTGLRRDLRMGDYIRRIPQAIARASFGEVTDEVLATAKNILYASVDSWR